MVLHEMSEDDALYANTVWPNRHPGSAFFMKRIAKWNANVGLYQSDGKLVAWCLRLQAGPLGALQVDNQFLRRGYGVLILKAITRKIGELGEDVYSCVGLENLPSIRTFEKVGFKVVDSTFWLRTKPTIPFTWNENE